MLEKKRIKAVQVGKWIICGKCAGKLCSVEDLKKSHSDGIFIKCHQCKEINEVEVNVK